MKVKTDHIFLSLGTTVPGTDTERYLVVEKVRASLPHGLKRNIVKLFIE